MNELAEARARVRAIVMQADISYVVYTRAGELTAALERDPDNAAMRLELEQLASALAAEQAQRDAYFARLDEAKAQLHAVERAMRAEIALN